MDFQPRLGVVTRALRLAGPDLLHFFVVAGSVFICYCMMGFLIFGNSLPWFDTFSHSINTCFEMLLGEFADVSSDLRALGGLQVRPGDAARQRGDGRGMLRLLCRACRALPSRATPAPAVTPPGRCWRAVLLEL